MKKIGIFAGTFDPVHKGHIEFALAAAANAGLDTVIFLPERQPRGKDEVTDYDTRVGALKRAIAAIDKLRLWDFPETKFTVSETLPRISSKLPGAKLYLLIGSDVAKDISDWPKASELLKSAKLIVGLRGSDRRDEIENILPGAIILNSPYPQLSSADIRASGRTQTTS